MSKFHDFDPLARLEQIEKTATIALSNTHALAQAHDVQEQFFAQIIEQHKSIVELIHVVRSEVLAVTIELNRIKDKIN